MKPLPLGHDDEIRFFLQQHDAGKLAHAWLLQGPKGIGKSLVAKALTLMNNNGENDDMEMEDVEMEQNEGIKPNFPALSVEEMNVKIEKKKKDRNN